MHLTMRGRALAVVVVLGLAVLLAETLGRPAGGPAGPPSAARPVAHHRTLRPSPSASSLRPSTPASTVAGPSPASSPSGRSPTPAAPSPGLTPQPAAGVPRHGTGRLTTVGGRSAIGGSGPLHLYRVQVEGGIGEDGVAFAAAVQATLTDPRSWGHQFRFRRVSDGHYDFTVVLASPVLTEELCRPLQVHYRLSCRSGGNSVVNDLRWRTGAPSYGTDLAGYRHYVVDHEVGHMLGHGHLPCAGAGRLAPVMMQQTLGVGACRPNPWPFPHAG